MLVARLFLVPPTFPRCCYRAARGMVSPRERSHRGAQARKRPAACYDTIERAEADGCDLVLIDTAVTPAYV